MRRNDFLRSSPRAFALDEGLFAVTLLLDLAGRFVCGSSQGSHLVVKLFKGTRTTTFVADRLWVLTNNQKVQPLPNLELGMLASALVSVFPGSCDSDIVEAKSLDTKNFSLSGSRPGDAFLLLIPEQTSCQARSRAFTWF